jgi:hypothetical protein
MSVIEEISSVLADAFDDLRPGNSARMCSRLGRCFRKLIEGEAKNRKSTCGLEDETGEERLTMKIA